MPIFIFMSCGHSRHVPLKVQNSVETPREFFDELYQKNGLYALYSTVILFQN